MRDLTEEKAKGKVVIFGLRGFPGVQGGVETHVQNLAVELVKIGWSVEVIVRSPYQPELGSDVWNGISIKPIWCPTSNGLEPVVHSLLAVLYALYRKPDLVHIQAIGPALVAPIAKLFGLKVVVTHHGPDYDRQKWGKIGKLVLKLGELMGMRFADQRIAISRTIATIIADKYGLESKIVPNGVNAPLVPESQNALAELGVDPRRYFLIVSRLVPEKRHLDLIKAFIQAKIPGWRLVIVGAADHLSDYVGEVHETASEDSNVVLAGFRSGVSLAEIYANAGVFVLPSSHEGLPIALLEALSYGVPSIASDIPANLEVSLPDYCYFPLGNIDALSERMRFFASQDGGFFSTIKDSVLSRYDWVNVSQLTSLVYLDALNDR